MRSASRQALAAVLAGTALALDLAAVVMFATQAAGGEFVPLNGNTLAGITLGATFPIVGWLVASRRPANLMGWIFLGIGASQAITTFATPYSSHRLGPGEVLLPFAAEVGWAGGWSWAPGFVMLLTLSVLLFPDGRLPSRRWRFVPLVAGLALVTFIVPIAAITWPIRKTLVADRAFAEQLLVETTGPILIGLLLLGIAATASLAALIARFRRSRGVERQQLKWFTLAGTIEIGTFTLSPFLGFGEEPTLTNAIIALVVAPLLPIAAGIAILRYRLYDIDVVIRRTLVYGAVVAVLGALYVALMLGLQALLATATGGDTVAVALSTLAIAALFGPVRARVRDAVDRRFYRSRYDAQRTLESFASRLRGEVELEAVGTALVAAVTQTVRPASVGMWLRGRRT